MKNTVMPIKSSHTVNPVTNKVTNENTVWHQSSVLRSHREHLYRHRGAIIWFTGLSGSGKSTLANALAEALHQRQARTYVLDGDNVRHGLCGDLGFSDLDRTENIRRIGEVSKLMMDAGLIVLTAFISPFVKDRQMVRNLVGKEEYIEVHCDTPLHVCEQRDVKGLYRKARKGEIQDFTGISSPYEKPANADVSINTADYSINECVDQILIHLESSGIIMSVSDQLLAG